MAFFSNKNFKNSENLKLLKQKDTCRYEYMNSFERFNEKKIAC